MLITDPLFYAIAIPVVLLSGISKTGIPGLFGGMSVPLLSLVIPPLQAAALMLPILCFIDLFGLRAFQGTYDRRNMPILLTVSLSDRDRDARLHPAAARLHANHDRRHCRCVCAEQHSRLGPEPPARRSVVASWRPLVGALGTHQLRGTRRCGADHGLSAASEAPSQRLCRHDRMVLLCLELREDHPLRRLGASRSHQSCDGLVPLPPVPVGVKLGVVIQGKLDEKVFYQISYWALLGIGVKLLYDGMAAFLR